MMRKKNDGFEWDYESMRDFYLQNKKIPPGRHNPFLVMDVKMGVFRGRACYRGTKKKIA